MTIREMREERMRLYEQAKAVLAVSKKDKRLFSSEEQEKIKKIYAEMDTLEAQIDAEERLIEEKRALERHDTPRVGPAGAESAAGTAMVASERKVKLSRAFDQFLRGGLKGMDEESRAIYAESEKKMPPEMRALSVGTDTAGGFMVPEDINFIDQLEVALKFFGGMRRANTTIITTATGADLPIPTTDDTSNVGELLAENAAAATQDVVFAQIVLQAFMYSSKQVRVSLQLLQDSAVDVGGLLARLLGTRIGRITNTHFTVGTGTGQPNGVVVASTQGRVGATGQTTSIIYADLVELFHSVDPGYRDNAQWMMNDASLAKIKQIEDTAGHLIWQPSLVAGAPDLILGKGFVVNNDVVVMAANAKSVLFGDFSKYWIRDVQGMILFRLVERYAEFLQVGFLAFSRHDGDLIDAGTAPIKHYANSAT